MSEWVKLKLKDVTTKIGSGLTPRGGSEVFIPKGVLFIRSQNVREGKIDDSSPTYISSELDQSMLRTRVRRNDILYNITGASIGRSAIYERDDAANVNQHVCIVRVDPTKASPRFVSYLLSSGSARQQLYGFQAGGNREGLNFQQLGSYSFIFPPIDEQRQIVQIFETWDKKLDILASKKIGLKRLKSHLMSDLIIGKTRLHNFKKPWVDSEFGKVCKIENGFAFSSKFFNTNSDGIRLVRNRDLKSDNDQLYYHDKEFNERYIINNGDILIGMDGDFIASKWMRGRALLNQRVGRLHVKDGNDADFLYYRCQSELKRIENETSSTTVKHLSANKLESRKLRLPEYEEQVAIGKVLKSVDKSLEDLNKQIALTERQKQYLLKNLISGKVRVPDNMRLEDTQS